MTSQGREGVARTRQARRLTLRLLLVFFAGTLLLRYAAYSLPWVGAEGADLLRRVIGRGAVTRLEELTAAVEDHWHRFWRPHPRPRKLAEVEQPPAAVASPTEPQPGEELPPPPPLDVGPMDARVAAPGDGTWRPATNPNRPEDPPLLFVTMLHPDAKRSWAEVFVVALELERVRVHAVAGSIEPKSTTAEGQSAARPALVPAEQQPALVAAFNGGFKTEHGQHGMHVDGVTLVPPRNGLCTVVGLDDGRLFVGSWEAAADTVSAARAHLLFWRQAAPCLVERGLTNAALREERTRRWGATIDGETVIRRSALGLSGDGRRLYVAVTNATTAPALASAMLHAGAADVAQLDVNWSYPKFVLFPRDASGALHAKTLFDGFPIDPDAFVRKRYPRDFFYLTTTSPKLTR